MSIYDGDDTPLFNELNPKETVIVDRTPNVGIKNSNTRRFLTTAAGIISAVLGSVIIADMTSTKIDWREWTDPIAAVFLWLAGTYGIGVVLPNTPKNNGTQD